MSCVKHIVLAELKAVAPESNAGEEQLEQLAGDNLMHLDTVRVDDRVKPHQQEAWQRSHKKIEWRRLLPDTMTLCKSILTANWGY